MEKNTYPKILFPYDFSPESDHAIKYLDGLADIFQYSIDVLNILDPGTMEFLRKNNLTRKDLDGKVAALTEEITKRHKIPATYVINNVPIKKIRKISTKEDAEFIFLALTEPQNMASRIMKVVTTSPVPAFVVQNGVDFKPIKNILFPLDDSPTSRQKASWALRFAKKTGAKIHIFSINPATLGDKERQQKQYRIIESVEEFFTKNHVPYVSEISKGGDAEFDGEIMDYASNHEIDLYVIMIPRKMFKSISQRDFKLIFNPTKIPILCVNHRDVLVSGGFN
jgi:nucleotide-binding universal stress UspA family protein